MEVDHSDARARNSHSFSKMAPIALGFKKSTTALGENKLVECDQAKLSTLTGDDDDDEEEEKEHEESEEEESVDEGEEPNEVSGSEEEDEEVLDADEVGEGGSGSQGVSTEGGESSGDEDGLALDELEDVELHPDVVPRRGVKVIDNKVCAAWVWEFSYPILCLGSTRKD